MAKLMKLLKASATDKVYYAEGVCVFSGCVLQRTALQELFWVLKESTLRQLCKGTSSSVFMKVYILTYGFGDAFGGPCLGCFRSLLWGCCVHVLCYCWLSEGLVETYFCISTGGAVNNLQKIIFITKNVGIILLHLTASSSCMHVSQATPTCPTLKATLRFPLLPLPVGLATPTSPTPN